MRNERGWDRRDKGKSGAFDSICSVITWPIFVHSRFLGNFSFCVCVCVCVICTHGEWIIILHLHELTQRRLSQVAAEEHRLQTVTAVK